MIEVSCRIKTYPSESADEAHYIKVNSHWNDPLKVQLEIEGKFYVVVANDLLAAIDNAKHTG